MGSQREAEKGGSYRDGSLKSQSRGGESEGDTDIKISQPETISDPQTQTSRDLGSADRRAGAWGEGPQGRTQEAAPEGGNGGRARDGAWLSGILSVGVHSKASARGARGPAQLHVHHVHVCEAGASRVVSLAGLPPPHPPTHLSSPEISHKHPDHVVKTQAGGGQCSGRHGVGVARGQGAEPTDRTFVEHCARPSAGHCSQPSLEPEAIGVRGHGDTKTLEVTARVTGPGSLEAPSGLPGIPAGPHLEAPCCVQSRDVLSAPQGPPGHEHGMVPAM